MITLYQCAECKSLGTVVFRFGGENLCRDCKLARSCGSSLAGPGVSKDVVVMLADGTKFFLTAAGISKAGKLEVKSEPVVNRTLQPSRKFREDIL